MTLLNLKKPPVKGSVDDMSSFRRSPMASNHNISWNREAVKKFSLDTDGNRPVIDKFSMMRRGRTEVGDLFMPDDAPHLPHRKSAVWHRFIGIWAIAWGRE